MTKQKAVLLMIAPVAASLKERKAEWEEIEELIDYFGDLYDKVMELVPEEEDEIDSKLYDDDESFYEDMVKTIHEAEPKAHDVVDETNPWKSVNEYMSGKQAPIAAPVYDPNIVTASDEEIISNYFKEQTKEEQYIPFVEEVVKEKTKEIKSKGSIL